MSATQQKFRGATASASAIELDEVASPDVPKKYRGTEADNFHMKVLGRVQETRRNFTFITILGFGSTLICTWEVILAAGILPALTNGGTAGFFWGWLIVVSGFMLVYSSLSELASMIYGAHISFQSGLTGISFMAAGIIQGLIVLNDPGYVGQAWHGTLLTIAVCVFAIFFNTMVASKLPLVEGTLVLLHIAGLFVVIIVLWTLAPRHTAHDAFLHITNNGSWSTDGISLVVGLYPLVVALMGFDSAVHMSEEIKDAASTLPRSIMWSMALNAFLDFLMVVTLIFTWGNLSEIVETATGMPFLQILYDVTGSLAAVDILAAAVIITLTASVIAVVATASRQIWAFGRDNGVPFSGVIAHVNPRWNIPVNAVLVSLLATSLLSLINIGSAVALNAILSLNCASLLGSYMLSIGCLVYRRLRGPELPPRPWSLGKTGLWINLAALCWVLPIFVFTLFPGVPNPSPAEMNWGVLLFGFMIVFATAYYMIIGRHMYISPKQRLRRDLQM